MYIIDITEQSELMTLEVDHYSPLMIEFGKNHSDKIYFRYTSDYSLLELGVSPQSGAVCSINLIQIPGLDRNNVHVQPSNVKYGLPIFDVLLWKGKKLFDIDLPVTLSLTGSSALLKIGEERSAGNVFCCQGVDFGVLDGDLCWILIKDLTDEQVNKIRGTVNHNSCSGFL